jgi:lipid-A-disaccharide synthase
MSLFFVTGELSGDLHGAALLRALRQQGFNGACAGVGGPKLIEAGMQPLVRCEELATMGWIAVAGQLVKLLRILSQVEQHILRTEPPAVVMVDAPSFNLRLAQRLRKAGYRGVLIQYICPKVWAHGRGRIATMAQTLDLLLAIHPFEPPLFAETGLKASYVGHPLVTQLQAVSIDQPRRTLALFPGSRASVVRANLPLQLQAALPLATQYPLAISVAQESLRPLIEQLAPGVALIERDQTHQLMATSHAALATCGTVTLELALLKVPTVVTYQVHPVDRLIARYLLGLKSGADYSLPNIIAQQPVFPELVESRLDFRLVRQKLEELCAEGSDRQRALAGCDLVAAKLGREDASSNAAALIMQLVAVSSRT